MATTNTKTDPRHYLNYLNGEDGSEESSIEDMSRDIGHGGDCEAISYEMISDIEMSGVDASGIDAVADVDESFFAEKDDGGSRGLLDDVSLGSHHGSLGHAGHASSASSHSGSILAPPPGNGHESLVDLDSIEGTDGDSEAEQEALQDDDDEEEVEDYENIYENVYEPQDERRTYLNLNLNPNPNTNTNTNTNPNLANAQTLSVVQRLLPNEAEEMSVSSIPRSALPRITGNGNGNGNGTGSVPSMLSSKTHPEQEAQRETSGSLVSLLDPPDATDYAPADCFTPGVSILPKSNVNAIANANRSNSNSNSNADERRKNRSKNNRTNGNWRVAEMTSRTAGRDTDRASTSRSSNTNSNTNTNTNQVLNNKPSKSGATRKQETAEQKQQREQQERVVAANTMAARELPPPPQQRPNGDAANANANANANADANSDVDADANANANANADTSYHNNYSHLLSAYEFEHDPSIPPLPPPVVELVQSPTDERYCSTTGNNQSPNTSYESDIELGRNEDDQGVQGKTKTPRGTDPSADPSTSKKKKTLLSVFSPTYFRPNDDNDNADADADKDENKEGNTPETDTNLSPSNTFEEGSIARGRKLFSPEEPGATRSNNNAHRSSDRSFDDLYYDDESGHKTGESASHRDGDSSKAVSKQNQRKRKGNPRCLWIWIIVFSVLVIGAATGVIAYSMIKKSRAMNAEAELEASSANDVAIDGIANVANVAIDGGDQSESESQSENTNLGANTPDDPQSQEVLVVLPPVPPPTLRPVTLKDPTGAPSEYPTVAPTFPRPTMFPTSTPTVSPTISPTVAKSATDQLTERLEGLLQSRNYANGGGGVGDETQEQAQLPQEPFSFDFSAQNIASGGMNDPAHKALLYMAREAEATHGLSLSLANANANSNNSKDSFVPIDLASYDNPKLMQRFALLAVRFGATLSSGSAVAEAQTQTQVPTEFATAWIANSPGLAVALPAKRIVVPGGEAGENAGDLEGGEVQPTVGSATATAVANANSNANVAGGSDTSSAIGMVTAPTTDGAPTQANPLPSSLADPDDPMFLVDECYWEGVVCEAENETENSNSTATTTPRIPAVVSLKWGYLTLSGTISPAVGLLSGLTSLDLSHNELVGSIPESLFDLTSLRELYLYHNNLTGTLSTRIGDLDALERLHLSHNALSGSLPTELKSDAGSVGGIRPLRYFNVYSNKFTGTIPSDLRWRQCIHFDVGRNQLTGTLPEDIGEKFVDLRHLYLDHNAFIGTLPSSYNTVGNGRLKALAIDHNRLTGEVPGARDHYDNLVQYTLHENLFRSLDQRNCQNHLLVEFKADCNANVCTCFGGFEFCERWCGYESGGRGPNNPARNPTFDSNPNLNWQQQQQRPPWQRPPQDWSF